MLIIRYIRTCLLLTSGLFLSACKASSQDGSRELDIGLLSPDSNVTGVLFLDDATDSIHGWRCAPPVVDGLTRATCRREGPDVGPIAVARFTQGLTVFYPVAPYDASDESLRSLDAYLARPDLPADTAARLRIIRQNVERIRGLVARLRAGADVAFVQGSPEYTALVLATGIAMPEHMSFQPVMDWLLARPRVRLDSRAVRILQDLTYPPSGRETAYTRELWVQRNWTQCNFLLHAPAAVVPADDLRIPRSFEQSLLVWGPGIQTIEPPYDDAVAFSIVIANEAPHHGFFSCYRVASANGGANQAPFDRTVVGLPSLADLSAMLVQDQ